MANPLKRLIEKFQLQNQKERNTVTTDESIYICTNDMNR